MELAEQLWTRVLAVSPADPKALKALRRVWSKGQSETKKPAPPTSSPEPEVELRSEVGVDYTRLRNLLAAGKWKEADKETASVMLKASGFEGRGYLDISEIKRISCTDLRTINQLWVKYSDGHFGFSVQQGIYESLGGTEIYNPIIWKDFSERVGWSLEGRWRNNSTFPSNAFAGYLPLVETLPIMPDGNNFSWDDLNWFKIYNVFSHLANCKEKPESSFVLNTEVELRSEKGVDYTRLRELLAAGQWKQADKETVTVLLKAAGSEGRDNFDLEDMDKIPCTDLRTIDQLWVKYSSGRFGFSVQKCIWKEVGGKVDYETEKRLGERVGWRKSGSWLDYSDLTFSTQAPVGHLPGMRYLAGGWSAQTEGMVSRYLKQGYLMEGVYLLSRTYL